MNSLVRLVYWNRNRPKETELQQRKDDGKTTQKLSNNCHLPDPSFVYHFPLQNSCTRLCSRIRLGGNFLRRSHPLVLLWMRSSRMWMRSGRMYRDLAECGWDLVECGWDLAECGLDLAEWNCGWDLAVWLKRMTLPIAKTQQSSFDPSIIRHSGIWGVVEKQCWNRIKIKKIPQLNHYLKGTVAPN